MQKNLDLIGSAEAADMLGIDRATVTRWVHAGTLVPFTRGSGRTGEFLFERSTVLSIAPVESASPADSTGVSSIDGTAA
jgi:excisionase family DNA binding protein